MIIIMLSIIIGMVLAMVLPIIAIFIFGKIIEITKRWIDEAYWEQW